MTSRSLRFQWWLKSTRLYEIQQPGSKDSKKVKNSTALGILQVAIESQQTVEQIVVYKKYFVSVATGRQLRKG